MESVFNGIRTWFSDKALLHRLRQNFHEVFDSQRKMFFELGNTYKISQPSLTADEIHLAHP